MRARRVKPAGATPVLARGPAYSAALIPAAHAKSGQVVRTQALGGTLNQPNAEARRRGVSSKVKT